MIDFLTHLERDALWAVWTGVGLTAVMAIAVIIQRLALSADEARLRYLKHRYAPLIDRALAGDASALDALVHSPPRYRLALARMLLVPLVDDHHPARIAATRTIVRAMSLIAVADRWLRSRWWWRRSVALQALGLIQFKDRTGQIVAALDDTNGDVQNAALDALADMHDPATLPAIVGRLHDTSLQRGRRAAALAAFGPQCEGLLIDLSRADPEHRLNYAKALGICGTERSRPLLCEWTADPRVPVRAAALEALAHVGLDEQAVPVVIAALESDDVAVRTMAAGALRRWTGPGDGAARLARHLDDAWPVAISAARTLGSMGSAGRVVLKEQIARTDLAGMLARQMLWEADARA
jgi:HEAT repeat protein